MLDEKNFGGYAISIEMYKWILKNLPKGSIILELGSGKGTVELSEFYKVYSIEHDKRWLGFSKKSNYIYAPIVKYKRYKWYDIGRIKRLIPKNYDLLLVDGPNGYIGREGFVDNIGLFKTDIPIIIDDIQREKYVGMRDFLAKKFNKKVITIEGTGISHSRKKFSVLL